MKSRFKSQGKQNRKIVGEGDYGILLIEEIY